MRGRPFPHRLFLPATVVAALALVSASAAAPGERSSRRAERADVRDHGSQLFDARAAAAAAPATENAAQERLRRSLGLQGVVDVDPLTGTPRVVARLDGFLTGLSPGDPREVALDFVRAHPDVFKLDADDLAGLRLVRDYTDVAGIRHLLWAQTSRGISAFDNDLRASLTSDGRLINVLGSPLPDLEAPATGPALGPAAALGAALQDVGRPAGEPRVVARGRGRQQATSFAGGHRANLVLVNDGEGVRLAWRVTAHADSDEVYDSLVDASSGTVLRRVNKVEEATGLAWDYYPGAASGGAAATVDFTARGWLGGSAQTLHGPNAHVFNDLDDDDKATVLTRYGSEEVPRRIPTTGNWDYSFTPFSNPSSFCSPSTCSWDSDDPGNATTFPSWFKNRRQNATQVFYLVNTFHDHLENDPGIGFGAPPNEDEGFEGVDKVVAHSDDGAITGTPDSLYGPDMPDDFHLDNANMLTFPNGRSPRMQMYLFASLDPLVAGDQTPDVNGGDDAAVVYHEYTHGLSNRLVTYADGWGALDAFQSGSMGEAWSDWYAMDYLVAQGFAPDTATTGDVLLDRYVGNGQHSLRTQGLDCPVGVSSAGCPGGGYTYGDTGNVIGFPEVHADGEIWAQTLWDLRRHPGVGVVAARALVTEGMRLSPANPSFLDMRNAILQAALPGGHQDHVWEVFAGRGMGYFAATTDANDTAPIEDFELPPDPALGVGTLSGVVKDPDNGNAPVAGARVRISGNPANLSDVTDSLGRFMIPDVPVGTYPLIQATKNLYDPAVATNVVVQQGLTTALGTLQLRRDWSAFQGGARVSSFTPPNYSGIGCGPNGAIDQSLVTGWASDTGAQRRLVVKLPSYVDVTALALDPGATCGDPANAALAQYRFELSTNGSSWTVVKTGTFGPADNGVLNLFAIAKRTAIRHIRLTMISSQGHPAFMDMSELSVHGKMRPSCLGLAATKIGTEAANTMTGTAGPDVFVGLGGNDRFDGRGGNDVICGGNGNDTLIGGGGADKFDAGSGNDTVNARDGLRETVIRGGGGTDRLRRDSTDRATGFERSF